MDNSKEYIKMCEKAKEIQELQFVKKRYCFGDRIFWKFRKQSPSILGSGCAGFILAGGYEGFKVCIATRNERNVIVEKRDLIWLPYQDQLQEMVIPKELNCAFNYIGNVSRWVDKDIAYACGFDTMEQLWLAFVMSKRFNKIWKEEWWDWVKE